MLVEGSMKQGRPGLARVKPRTACLIAEEFLLTPSGDGLREVY